MGDRDHQPIRSIKIQQKHHQSAQQQRERQYARQRGKRLQLCFSENRGHGSNVQGPGRGDHQEHGEDMRKAPDNLVVHPGHDVAVMFHVGEGSQPKKRDGSEQTQQAIEAPCIRRKLVQRDGHDRGSCVVCQMPL